MNSIKCKVISAIALNTLLLTMSISPGAIASPSLLDAEITIDNSFRRITFSVINPNDEYLFMNYTFRVDKIGFPGFWNESGGFPAVPYHTTHFEIYYLVLYPSWVHVTVGYDRFMMEKHGLVIFGFYLLI